MGHHCSPGQRPVSASPQPGRDPHGGSPSAFNCLPRQASASSPVHKEAALSRGHVSIQQPALLLGRSGSVLTFLWESCVVLVGSDFPPYDHVFFKWKQLKKGWEKTEPQLPFLRRLDVPLPCFGSAEKALGPRSMGRGADAAPWSWGFGAPAPGSRQGFATHTKSAPECQMAF